MFWYAAAFGTGLVIGFFLGFFVYANNPEESGYVSGKIGDAADDLSDILNKNG